MTRPGVTAARSEMSPVSSADHFDLVSTGSLPARKLVRALMIEAHERFRDVDDGAVADYIPALARADPKLFGACITGAKGRSFAVGDSAVEFAIESVSKPFVFALVCEALGPDVAREKLGVNNTGMPFNSVLAVELHAQHVSNALANAGAIASTSLVPGATGDEKWEYLVDGLSRFAGRRLEVDEEVYASETATNLHNRGIALLLDSHQRIYFDPEVSTDVYTRQCSLRVTAEDLATMGATLATGGVNPLTGERVVSAATCPRVLALMASAGMYQQSGDWMYAVGLPGKSGVAGGMVTVAPGKGGLGCYSPPLDDAGNSVRGKLLTTFLSQRLGLNLFASASARPDGVRVAIRPGSEREIAT